MKKKRVLFVSIIIIITFISIIFLGKVQNKSVLESGILNSARDNKMISLMLETEFESGEYTKATDNTWPKTKYEFNTSLSKCENGGKIFWNEETGVVTLKTNISDKCYAYFDVIPPDVYVKARNIPTTVGALANLNCTGSSSTYDPKYNRIEVSSIDNKYTSCTLSYTNRIIKEEDYLNNKIMELVETTAEQTGWKVVNEVAKIVNNDATYNIAEMTYTKVSGSDLSISDNKYTGTDVTSKTTTYSKFIPITDGMYKVCYSIPASSYTSSTYRNYIKIYTANSTKSTLKTIYSNYNNGAVISDCFNYGYVTTMDYIYIENYYYHNNATIWFEKTDNFSNVNAGIRYEGKNPNNYVWFNNELWRIIGVFDETSHGQIGKKLVKIIRENPIGALVWNKHNINSWSSSSLNKLLNESYYNAENGTGGPYCYTNYINSSDEIGTITSNCDYTHTGIQNGYRNMIKNVTWYLGGLSGSSSDANYYVATSDDYYHYERGTAKYGSNPTRTKGYIGLMYPSDYGYSALASSCARTTRLTSYGSATCGGESWLRGKGSTGTITHITNASNFLVSIYITQGISYNSVTSGQAVRPTLYLDESVYVINGSEEGVGSMTNPYIIGM